MTIGHGRIVAQGRMTTWPATRPGCVADAEDQAAFATARAPAGITFSGRADVLLRSRPTPPCVVAQRLTGRCALTLLRPADGTRLEEHVRSHRRTPPRAGAGRHPTRRGRRRPAPHRPRSRHPPRECPPERAHPHEHRNHHHGPLGPAQNRRAAGCRSSPCCAWSCASRWTRAPARLC
ncbi:hypothetical protein QJS66_16085 [Kocuria rhizophila]|nr:hypothetical protein QJS66_16085 [Kocuria rhizophila]